MGLVGPNLTKLFLDSRVSGLISSQLFFGVTPALVFELKIGFKKAYLVFKQLAQLGLGSIEKARAWLWLKIFGLVPPLGPYKNESGSTPI